MCGRTIEHAHIPLRLSMHISAYRLSQAHARKRRVIRVHPTPLLLRPSHTCYCCFHGIFVLAQRRVYRGCPRSGSTKSSRLPLGEQRGKGNTPGGTPLQGVSCLASARSPSCTVACAWIRAWLLKLELLCRGQETKSNVRLRS